MKTFLYFFCLHIAYTATAIPKEDAHIESFNSILEREVIRRFEFETPEEADSAIAKSIIFYNSERLHSALDYRAPGKMYKEWEENLMER